MDNLTELKTQLEVQLKNERFERKNLEKVLSKLRNTLANIVPHLEDNGDEVRFQSTNDADRLREVYAEIDDFALEIFMREKGENPAPYETMRTMHESVAFLKANVTSVHCHNQGWLFIPSASPPESLNQRPPYFFIKDTDLFSAIRILQTKLEDVSKIPERNDDEQ